MSCENCGKRKNLKAFWGIFILLVAILLASVGCGTDKKEETTTTETGKNYRYIDREVYLPTGSSVTPQMSAALETIRQALTELQSASDLGTDYFQFLSAENSLLQPPLSATSFIGRNWLSFFQVFEDATLNEAIMQAQNAPSDPDIIAALNIANRKQWYVVLRLSCFTSGATCNFATTNQAKLMVWRSVGYLLGLRDGGAAGSLVMKPGLVPEDKMAEEKRKFLSEFNGALENMRNGVKNPGDNL